MENDNIPQPLDTIMTQLGISNADLVNASTEQLTFKMVNKGRKGRRLAPKIQEKILKALLTLKPESKLRRRDLFLYEPDESVVKQVTNALTLARSRKISYPQFVDLLGKAGITRYKADVGPNRITFFITQGEAHLEQGSTISESAPGNYNEDGIRSAITDAQKGVIDHPTFLRRIYEAGISVYEVNVQNRKIVYKGQTQVYRETIPSSTPAPKTVEATPAPKPPKKKAVKKVVKRKNHRRKNLTRKGRRGVNERRPKKRKLY